METKMAKLPDHPMDQFPVRPLRFDVAGLTTDSIIWSRTCPEFAVFVNALGVHVPYFERYLIAAMRKARPEVQGAELVQDISRIIGQEANHAVNFARFNELLAQRYPKVVQFDNDAKSYFAEHAQTDSLKKLVGFTAGYETFTFLAGLIILDNHNEWFADSDPVMKAMWVWHQVEEVEHGSVAFNVYQNLYGKDEAYRKWMVVRALTHIALETLKTYVHMVRVEGWLRNPFKAISCLCFCASMLTRLLVNALPVFRKNYHPRRHPRVTTRQNKIQIAWRRYDAGGGDVLSIDYEKHNELFDFIPDLKENATVIQVINTYKKTN
jgi:predicted metal-dependent hydrolase